MEHKRVSEKKDNVKNEILKELYFGETLSCAEVAAKIQKSLPLTTKLINELVEEEVIAETGLATSTGGRRPQTFSLAKEVMFVVSVAMDQLITRIAIMDMRNNFVTSVLKIEIQLSKNEDIIGVLVSSIDKVIERSGIAKHKLAGIGVAMPGFVNPAKGKNNSFVFSLQGSISDLISEAVGLPVFIDNDSSLIALAELKFGKAKGKANAVVLNVGWGVGMGMVLNGEMFRGSEGFAGEFSHIPLFNNEKLCSCGKFGCLETETSLLVLIEKATKGLSEGRISRLQSVAFTSNEQASQEIIMAAHGGDQFAVEMFSEIGYNLGRGVAVLIHILNPETIIISGRGSEAGKILKTPVQQAMNEHCIPILANNTTVEISAIGYQAELIGAAVLVMENFEKTRVVGSATSVTL